MFLKKAVLSYSSLVREGPCRERPAPPTERGTREEDTGEGLGLTQAEGRVERAEEGRRRQSTEGLVESALQRAPIESAL